MTLLVGAFSGAASYGAMSLAAGGMGFGGASTPAVLLASRGGLGTQVLMGGAGGVAGGFTGGMIGGTLNGLSAGQSWGQSLQSGWKAGVTGALWGGAFGAALPVLGYGARKAYSGARSLVGRIRVAKNGLPNGGTRGAPMDADELARIKAGYERTGGVIDQSADAQAYLRTRGVGGVTFNAKTILLPENPTRTAVFEELIHSSQHRLGMVTGRNVNQMEILAAEKLIRNRHAWRIANIETRQTIQTLRALRAAVQ